MENIIKPTLIKKNIELFYSEEHQKIIATIYIDEQNGDYFVNKSFIFKGFFLSHFSSESFRKTCSEKHRKLRNKIFFELFTSYPDVYKYNETTYLPEFKKECENVQFSLEFNSFSHLGGFLSGSNVNRELSLYILDEAGNKIKKYSEYFNRFGKAKIFTTEEELFKNFNIIESTNSVIDFLAKKIVIPQITQRKDKNITYNSPTSMKSKAKNNLEEFIKKFNETNNKHYNTQYCFLTQFLNLDTNLFDNKVSHIYASSLCTTEQEKYDDLNTLYVNSIFDKLIDSHSLTFQIKLDTQEVQIFIKADKMKESPLLSRLLVFSAFKENNKILFDYLTSCSSLKYWGKRNHEIGRKNRNCHKSFTLEEAISKGIFIKV